MRKPKVLVDARMVGPVGHGIANYVLDLAAELAERRLAFELEYLIGPECPAESVLRQLPHRESSVPFLALKELFLLAREISGDLFHTPSFSSLARYPVPYVQTVHDLNHLHFGGAFHRLYYRFLLLPSLAGAREVIAVSRFSQQEVTGWLRRHGIERNVALAANAIGPQAAPDREILGRLGLRGGEYFFCLSNPKPHKNVKLLEQAHLQAWERGPCLPLVVNIPGAVQKGLVRVTERLSPGEIAALFSEARAYFFPSLYEGFGRSPLEALLQGTCPVASAIPAHGEILHGVPEAKLLDPSDPAPWKETFLELSHLPKRQPSAESLDRVRRTYSRKALGDAMERIYARALGL